MVEQTVAARFGKSRGLDTDSTEGLEVRAVGGAWPGLQAQILLSLLCPWQ